MSFSICKSQNVGTYVYPLTIQVQNDSTMKEIGYFKFNPFTGTVTTRGTLKYSFQFYYQILSREAELTGGLKLIEEQINPDGSIKDLVKFKQAVTYYQTLKSKYGL